MSSFTYTTSLIGHVRYSEWNTWNHAVSFTTTRKLAPRWTLGLSGSGDLISQEQALFSPTTASNITSVQSSFDNLAAALLTSNFASPQLAAALNSTPLADSPVRNLLYGQKMFTSGVQSSLSYSYSPRLSVSLQAVVRRSQHLSEQQEAISRNSYVLANTTSGSAGVTVSYSLSPSTKVGGSVTSNRISSSLEDAYTTTALATLGRTFGKRWILRLNGGIGVVNPTRQTSLPISTRPHPAGGASLGFKTVSQMFLGSFDRTLSDPYGLGAATTSSAVGSWRWRRPGRSWWLESSAIWQQLQGNGLRNTSGLRTTAGLGRSFALNLSLFTQYGYQNYSGRSQYSVYGQGQSIVRVSLVWSPHSETLP
jgi:hypothetical protein